MITKKDLSRNNEPDFLSGEAILIDKDPGLTSFRIVQKIRHTIQVKKVGHAGTLDPAATGLLIVCTGKKTKEISTFQDLPKTYSGIITLGKRTDSMDAETEVVEEKDISGISEEDVLKAIDEFKGKIYQKPPMYSALKHNGKRLYKLARKGIQVEREPREVEIYRYEITKIDFPDVHFEVDCSKGTYIRVLADDLGIALGCGAHLKKLRRERIGDFSVEDALVIDEFMTRFNKTINDNVSAG